MATDAERRQRRLVMYRTDLGTQAALYPMEANAFTRPEWVFLLEPGQPLPNQVPGDPVSVEGPLAEGANPTLHAAGTEIHASRGLRRHALHGDRIFAERGDVVAHPQAIGWDESWRHVRSASTSSVAAWDRKTRVAILGAAAIFVLLIVYIASVVLGDGDGSFTRTAGSGAGLAAAVAGGAYAFRARRALRYARQVVRREPSRPMRMRLWWAAGGPQGPLAMAALFSHGTGDEAEAVAHVPVVNVPERLVTEEPVDVEVYGDPAEAPVIKLGDTLLWPAQGSYS